MSKLPQALIQSLQNVKGFDEEAFKEVHQSGVQITSVRLNPGKSVCCLEVSPFGGDLEGAVPWSSNGYYLAKRPSFTLDPLFHGGAYYVQEASSMFLEEVLKQTVDLSAGLKLLDLCAAPGGKSTLIQSLISEQSLLVSNEVIKARVNILSENITKWGAVNVIVTNNDPKDFQRLRNYFDVVVVDAPCSGSGLFRKDPKAIDEWSEDNVLHCAKRQQRILADILPALKPGGIIIYSTCSYSLEEDEWMADWMVEACSLESIKLNTDQSWGIVETVSAKTNSFGYRFYPDKLKGEGFFIAAFKKDTGEEEKLSVETKPKGKSKNKTENISAANIETLRPYLDDVEKYFFIMQQEQVIAMPKHLEKELPVIQSALYIKKAGITMGVIIRNELIPAHDLAVSICLHPLVTKVDVDKETALQYLRKQEISITTGSRGWILLSYRQLPIGWIKVMPNRVNNYYPASWRILNK